MSDNICKIKASIDKAAADVVKLLIEKHIKISTAESCTGGLISAAITSVSGSSEVFDLGICSYANSAKEKYLGVPRDLLESEGAVCEAVACRMAQGIKTASDSDIAVSVTGIAGPAGGTDQKPVGTVYIGLCTDSGCEARLYFADPENADGTDPRDYIRCSTTLSALLWIKEELQRLG